MVRRETFDVAVVGGGSGGMAAAAAAAQSGARTVVIERYGFLGGTLANAMVPTYCGLFVQGEQPVPAVGGFAEQVLARLPRFGIPREPVRSPSGNWIVLLTPEVLKVIGDALLQQAGAVMRCHAFLVGAEVVDRRIRSVTVADHAGLIEIAASCFVDASGEGDLAARAGVPMAGPAEAEQLQAASFCVRFGGIPPDVEIDRARLRDLIRTVEHEAGGPVLRENGGGLMRLPDSGDLWWMGIDVRTDGLGSEDLSLCEQRCRALAWTFLGLLRRLPGCEAASISATGPQIGVRESRHPMARAAVTGEDARLGRRSATTIGRGAWPMENHDRPGSPTFVPIGGEGFYDIPADCLRASAIGNLWFAGRTIGCDRAAYGSLRVMGTAFATGQAAGLAAALAADGTEDYQTLARRLTEQGAIL